MRVSRSLGCPAGARGFLLTALFACALFELALSSAAAQSLPLQSPAPVPQSAVAGGPADSEQVGVAAAVQGQVEVRSNQAVGRVAQSGKPIYLGDVVTTGPEGRLQILLLDETVFTIGPNSAVVIDEFVYDPASHDGQVSAQIVRGVFRFVTGKIAHKKPENMKVTLPAGTIGVRGTMVAGRVAGMQSLVALLGPGPNNRVGARIGRIEVGNEVNGRYHAVLVDEPGYGTTIEGPDTAPTPPAPLPSGVLDALNDALTVDSLADEDTSEDGATETPDLPSTDDNSTEVPSADTEGHEPPTVEQLHAMADAGLITPEQLTQMLTDREAWEGGDEATQEALMEKYGADDPATYEPSTDDSAVFDPSMYEYHEYEYFDPTAMFEPYNETSTTAAQETANASAMVADGIATKTQLSSIETGQFHYYATAPFVQDTKLGLPVNYAGQMEVVLNIDFGSKTIGGGGSRLSVNTQSFGGNILQNMFIGGISFNSGGGDLAMYEQSAGNLTGQFAIKNSGGIIGNVAGVHAVYNDGGLNHAEGMVNNIPRYDGLEP